MNQINKGNCDVSFCPCDSCRFKDKCIDECDYFKVYVVSLTMVRREVNYKDFIELQGKGS